MKATTTLAAIILLQAMNAQECVDIDGNVYGTVAIGTQLWMTDNLNTTRYQNGQNITTDLIDDLWNGWEYGAMCTYENTPGIEAVHGRLYNWYAGVDPRGLCPAGWHVPSDIEWMLLETELGMPVTEVNLFGTSRGEDENIGGKLKAVAGWDAPNAGADNSSGFGGFPGGMRYQNSDWCCVNSLATYWTSTSNDATFAFSRNLDYDFTSVFRWGGDQKVRGFSVRCLFDAPIGIEEPVRVEPMDITVSPNPTVGALLVTSLAGAKPNEIRVLNAFGQTVLANTWNGRAAVTIDLSPYENGVYFVEVRYADGTRAVERIVKQ